MIGINSFFNIFIYFLNKKCSHRMVFRNILKSKGCITWKNLSLHNNKNSLLRQLKNNHGIHLSKGGLNIMGFSTAMIVNLKLQRQLKFHNGATKQKNTSKT